MGHSNSSVTAVTTESFKKVKYDTYGHITGSSNVSKSDVLGLGIAEVQVGAAWSVTARSGDVWFKTFN